MQRIILTLLSLLLSSFVLTACGLKGPLYMPKDLAAAVSQSLGSDMAAHEKSTEKSCGRTVKEG